MDFSKQRKKAELTNIVKLSSKRVFRLSPSGRTEKTPLGSNCTRSVSYHHFGWAFPSSAKSRIDEYRQIEFKTRFSTFPIGAKGKNTPGIEIHDVGFIPLFSVGFSKQCKKAKLTNIFKLSSKRVFRLSPSGRNEKTPLGSKSTTSVSYHHFGWAFPSSAKSRIDKYRQIEFKTRFSTFPFGGKRKTPLGSNSTKSVSYHHFGWVFPSSAKRRIDEYRQIEFKTCFSTFPIGAKRKNTLGIELHEVSFIQLFWVGFFKQGKKSN